MNALRSLNRTLDRWFTAPEPNAAGRLGLFRIFFALFYLWQIRGDQYDTMTRIPWAEWEPLAYLKWLPQIPPEAFFNALNIALIAGLFFMLVGFRTRPATLLVLAAGVVLDVFAQSWGKVSHARMFLQTFIPAFMLFSQWGSTYSVDAILKRKRGARVSPADDTWRYSWVFHALLVVLCFLYLTAGANKLLGSWLEEPDVINNILLGGNVRLALAGKPANPLTPMIVQSPVLSQGTRAIALLFETLFPLALLSRRLRSFFIASALVFHTFNYFFLEVNFTAQLCIYAVFVDWQAMFNAVKRRDWGVERRLARVPAAALAVTAAGVGLAASVVWFQTTVIQHLFDFIVVARLWLFVGIIGIAWAVRAGIGLLHDTNAFVRMRRKRAPLPARTEAA